MARRRSPPASSPSGSSASASRSRPLAGVGFLLAVLTLARSASSSPPLKQEVRRRPPKPLRADRSPTGGAARSSTARGRPPSAAPSCCSCWPSRSSACASASPTRATSPRTPPPARPTTSSPTASAPASTARSCWPPEVDGAADPAVLDGITAAVAADPGVAFVSPAISDTVAGQDGGHHAYLWQVTPTTSPQDEATTELVHRLRDDVLVAGEAALGTRDRRHRPGAGHGRLLRTCSARGCRTSSSPCWSLSFLLLMAVFRSLLVPLKAVLMNLLSIGAAYGIIVAVVQWGWLSDLTGLAPGPDRDVRPDDVLRHRVRAVDGLRGVPPVPGEGGVEPHRRQPHVGRQRPGRHRPGDHGRRRDHGVRLRLASCSRTTARSSCSASASPRRSSSTPPSSGCSSCPPRWSCSATATGGCPAGSTGSSRTSTSRARPTTSTSTREADDARRGARARLNRELSPA